MQRAPQPSARRAAQSRRVVTAPVATNVSNGRSGTKTIRVTERERVATLSGSTDFTVQHSLSINPAMPEFLPWLSTMAQLYEKYRVKSIRVLYHNLKGTDTAGNVLMAFDPDPLDSAPADAVSFTQSSRYIDGAPWRLLTLNIPGSNQTYFTRTAGVPSSDLKTYDYGKVHIATEAMASDSSPVGYIEIAYDIELLERQPAPTGGGQYSFRPQVYVGVPDPSVPIMFTHKDNNGGTPSYQTVEFDGVLPLAALVDDIGISSFNGSLVLPPGVYHLAASLKGSDSRTFCKEGNDGKDDYGTQEMGPTPNFSALAAAIFDSYGGPYKGGFYAQDGLDCDFHFVDSTGTKVDSVGLADLTGISLRAKFRFRLLTPVSVNGRLLEGDGQFTTTLKPSAQGQNPWPTAVITKIDSP